jgi:hypothetical protein
MRSRDGRTGPAAGFEDGVPFSRLLGASVLSAIGSLPNHIGPIIIVAIVADARVSVAEAGWVLSASAVGELLASLLLPAVGLVHLSRPSALAAGACLVLALGISMLPGLAATLLGFFVVGICCGVLKLLGTVAAANYPHRTFAFLLRLGLVLALAGIAACGLLALAAYSSWPTLIEGLTVLLLPLLVLGGCLYRPQNRSPSASAPLAQALPSPARPLAGLAILYLYFVGISGFFAYAAHQVSAKGMVVSDAILAIGTMKIAAAAWLLIAASLAPDKEGKGIGMLETALLVAALWGIFLSRGIAELLVGLLMLEITINTISARLQSAIVGAAPRFSGQWLTAVILLGVATGPPLYGLAISIRLEAALLVLISIVVCLPLAWQRLAAGRLAPWKRKRV